MRTNLGNESSRWRTLTAAQRTAWAAIAPNFTRTDSLGQTYTLNGQTAFLSVQRNIDTYGGTPSSDPPAYTPPAALATMTPTLTTGPDVVSLAFTATPLAAGTKIAVFATRCLSPGINFQPNGAYKLLKVSTAAQASPLVCSTEYAALFGALVPDAKILFKVVTISQEGLASTILQTSGIVA